MHSYVDPEKGAMVEVHVDLDDAFDARRADQLSVQLVGRRRSPSFKGTSSRALHSSNGVDDL